MFVGQVPPWRRGWDSNPRWACTHGGFQDRCLKPLGHLSAVGELSRATPSCARRAVNQAGLNRVFPSSLRCCEEGALGMAGGVFVGLSAVSLSVATATHRTTPAAPVQLAQADITTPSYAPPAMDPWYGYKLRLAALARQQGVREGTIQANVLGLTRNQRIIELERTEPIARSSGGIVGALAPYLWSHVTGSLIRRGR